MVFRTVARSSSGVGAFASSSCHPCGRRWLPCGGCPATRCGTQFLPKIYKRCCIFAWSTCLLDDVHDTDAEAPALQHLMMYQNSSQHITTYHILVCTYISLYISYTYIYIYTCWRSKAVEEDEEEQLPLDLAKQVISLVHDSRRKHSMIIYRKWVSCFSWIYRGEHKWVVATSLLHSRNVSNAVTITSFVTCFL